MSDHEQGWPEGLVEGESIELGPNDRLEESAVEWIGAGAAVTTLALQGVQTWAAVQTYRMQREQHEEQAPQEQGIILPPHVEDDR